MNRRWLCVVCLWGVALLCLQASPISGQGEGFLIDDFERSDAAERWWSWDDGSTFDCAPDSPGHASPTALHLTFAIDTDQYPGCGTGLTDTAHWADATGIRFSWRSDPPGLPATVVLVMADPTQTNPDSPGATPFNAFTLPPSDAWSEVSLPWEEFVKAEWVGATGTRSLDPAQVTELLIQPDPSQRGSIWLDDLWLMAAEAPPAALESTSSGAYDKFALWTGETQLRGANIWQRVVVPWVDGNEFLGDGYVGPPVIQEDFDRLAALGANVVNLTGPGLFTEQPPYVLDEAVAENLDSLLAMAAQADLFAVITARTGPGRSDFTFYWDESADWGDASLINDDVWLTQEAQDGWVAMWRATAERYRDNPIVVGYDLMCEPNAPDRLLEIWESTDFYPAYAGTLYDWNQLYPRIVAAIREVDPDTPILISGMGWGSVRWLPALVPVDDPRVVYMVHQYEPQAQYTHQAPPALNSYPGQFDLSYDGIPDRFDRAWLDDYLNIIDAFKARYDVPVAVNEYGVMRWVPGAAAFMRDSMALFEQRGMNHAFYTWSQQWPPYGEVDDFNYLRGPDPANHSDLDSNAVLEVIREDWSQNTVRPSNVGQ